MRKRKRVKQYKARVEYDAIQVTMFNLIYLNKTKNQGILLVTLQTNKIPTIVGQTNKRIRL